MAAASIFGSPILSSSRSTLLGALGLLLCTFGVAGCTGTVRTQAMVVSDEPDVIWVDTVPMYIETYPREYYGGATVYLVDGRWYRRSGDRWVVYRREPVELGRRRVTVERSYRQKPPARVEHRHERREERRHRR